jgi:hypothetical protein
MEDVRSDVETEVAPATPGRGRIRGKVMERQVGFV